VGEKAVARRSALRLRLSASWSSVTRLIGHKVSRIDDTPIAEALEILQAVTFAENSQLEALMGDGDIPLAEFVTSAARYAAATCPG